MTLPRIASLALLLLLASGGSARLHAQQAPEDLARFPQSELAVKSGKQLHKFRIWLADTSSRKQQGLMFVRDLPADRGMLFVNDQPYIASMWMKNTYLPLDMLFIDAKGRVVHIAAQTKPHSLDTISSNEPVTMVLELRGGEAGKREIAVGDRVRASPDKP